MKSRNLYHNTLFFAICILSLLGLFSERGFAQSGSYVVQIKDVLKLSFWEYPELNTQVAVDRDGNIDLPVVGRIAAAGLSLNVLREKVISQMSLYNRVVTQLTIEIVEYGSNTVYVTGQVRKPGKYSWEVIPNLWEILLEAGGPQENADLEDVVIVRSQEDGKIYNVNLTEALQNAKLNELPEIKASDTIQVPSVSGSGGITTSPLAKRDMVYIFGAIARPGAHRLVSTSNLVEVIGQAGGPARNADLRKVTHLSVTNGRTSIAEINLERYFNEAYPLPMPIGPGDTIIIPRKASFGSRIVNTLITTAITVTVSATLFAILR